MKGGFHLGVIGLVLRKELAESLRDKRTLFVALILPVLVYPLVFLGFGPLIGRQQQKLDSTSQPVVITGADADQAAAVVLDADRPPPDGADGAGGADGSAAPPPLIRVRSENPRADLEARKIALWIEVPEGFDEATLRRHLAQLGKPGSRA